MEPKATTQETKSIFKSKTAIVNILILAAGFIPAVKEFITANPSAVVTILSAANLILRLVTKSKIELFDNA